MPARSARPAVWRSGSTPITPAPPSLDDQYKGQCLAAQHASILAPYKTVKIKGVKSSELRFTVPPELLHPAQGLDVTVRDVTSSIKKIVSKGKVKVAARSGRSASTRPLAARAASARFR